MHGTRKLSDLIEEIYDAALEPALWNDVVVSINDFIGSRACGLISKDMTSQFGLTHYYCGVDPHYIQLYADTHSRFDPLTTLPSPGQVVSIPDLVRYDEYRQGPFYQEWLRPQGCVDVANVVLEKPSSDCAVLLTVLPGTQMLGDEMLRANDFLRSIGGQLVAGNAQGNRTLREIVADGGGAPGRKGTALPLTAQDGERYVMHVLPLTAAARAATGIAYKAVAALFVRRVALDNLVGGLVARHFELTPAELRVLLSIVEIGGVPETAAALGVAETTVKTHLHRVFSKTGASRQADLVKLAAGFSSPLAG